MRKKSLSSLVLIFLLTSSFIFAEGKGEEAAKAGEPVTIELYWPWASELNHEAIKSIVERFENLNPDIKVQITLAGGYSLYEKLLTAYAGGEPPDLSAMIFTSQFAIRGVLRPLDDLFDASKSIKREDFFEASLRQATYGGKLYGVPCLEHGPQLALIGNKRLIQEAGLNLSDFPETWEDVWEWNNKLTVLDKAGNLDIVGYDPRSDVGGRNYMWEASYGIKCYDPEKEKYCWDDPAWVEILQYINRYYKKWGPERFDAFRKSNRDFFSPQSSIVTGKKALTVNGYFSAGKLALLVPDEEFHYSWIPVPESRRGVKVANLGCFSICIPQGTEHPKESFSFIEFLLSNEVLDITFDKCGFITATKPYIKHINKTRYPGFDFFINSLLKAAEIYPNSAGTDPLGKYSWDAWIRATEQVVFGKKTPEEATAELQKASMQELNKLLSSL